MIRQRELLLQTALDQSPIAIVLVNPLSRVVYANHEARRLLLGGSKLEGKKFDEILDSAALQRCARCSTAQSDGIFTVEHDDEDPETYHLSQRSLLSQPLPAHAVPAATDDRPSWPGRRRRSGRR